MSNNYPANIDRRGFLRQLGGGALLTALPFPVLAEDEEQVTVSIFNTTDLHGHIVPTHTYPGEDGKVVEDVGGLARCATQIRAWRKQNPNHLLLDVGDVYQGTHVSLSTRGRLMMSLFNSLNYDAWVIGNHEFDWGPEPLAAAVTMSTGAVLGSNAKVGGVYANLLKDQSHPLARIKPYLIKEVAGFRIGIIGSITPGLPAWSAPRLLGCFEAAPPVRSIHYAMSRLKKEGVDAVVVAAHMGLKGIGSADDFANRIKQIAKEVPGICGIIGAHTHREIPSHRLGEVAYTQAGYYGIQCGRMDLVFSKRTRKLLAVKVGTTLMDGSIAQDPAVLSASAKDRKVSDAEWIRKIGNLRDDLSKQSAPGRPAQTLLLLTRSIRFALEQRKVPVYGVLHGNFLEIDLKAGAKTIADAWEIVPYENHLCTAGFTREELVVVLEEVFNSRYSTHNLDGFEVTTKKDGRKVKVVDVTLPGGKSLDPERRYRIALNSYDAQSGGRRFQALNRIATSAAAGQEFFEIQSREAVVEFFTEKKSIGLEELGEKG
ncbi:MAG: bifunctional metallophosphatase/5'-nucleotidase [Akkermansiaceae bacterium]|nr:bifunctional metallophosphatase/5'-nucleotidase [Akkermansiaceae bacterium]MCF7733065.1 bifunctional metallophosphatase/5'-nucleotidase [Akkermansiaceae bacterium]